MHRGFLLPILFFVSTTSLVSTCLAAPQEFTGSAIMDGVLSTLLYSGIGIIMAFVAFKICDLIIPGNLSKDIANNNIALAIVAGSSMLGVCIIIAAAIAG